MLGGVAIPIDAVAESVLYQLFNEVFAHIQGLTTNGVR